MRRALLIAVVALVAAVAAGCASGATRSTGSSTVTSGHTAVVTAGDSGTVTAVAAANGNEGVCASEDCGPYSASLRWSITWTTHTATGYLTYIDGTQEDDVTASPWLASGMDCGTTYTLGVRAHDGSGNQSSLFTTSYTTPDCPEDSPFPLQVSGNGRFLEDASGDPWLMVGDSPQSIVGNLSEVKADAYLDNRETHGFDAVWDNVLCDDYTACASNGQTADSVKPFTTGTTPSTYDLSTPNSTYFARAHDIYAHAEADGIEMLVDPISTDGCTSGTFFTTLTSNGNGTTSTSTNDYKYGQFLGTEFGDLNNIIWLSGNDFQCQGTTADSNDALAVAEGIANTDPAALQTIELEFNISSSLDNTSWGSFVNLNAAYTYAPTYDEVRHAYGQTTTQPAFMVEANYEGQKNGSDDGCGSGPADDSTARNCRLQEWWTMTSGATGQLYGGPCYGITNSTTLSSCNTVGVSELQDQTSFLSSVAWQDLVPDTDGTLVTSGAGTCPTTGDFGSVNCVTDAETPDQTLALAYFPDPGGTLKTVTVDLSEMAGSITARWLDPTDGDFSSISGSPFANTGTHNFTPPGTNSAGDSDWVLVLQAS